jgi:hypothetical protein
MRMFWMHTRTRTFRLHLRARMPGCLVCVLLCSGFVCVRVCLGSYAYACVGTYMYAYVGCIWEGFLFRNFVMFSQSEKFSKSGNHP